MNEKKQFTQEDLEQILGGTTNTTGTTSTCGTIESDKLSDPSKATTTGASRTGAQQAAVSDNLT